MVWLSGEPKVEFAPYAKAKRGARGVRLLENYRCKDAVGDRLSVPKDFVFDGASIPQALWSLVGNPFEEALEAGTIHDWLYFTGMRGRDYADRLFYDILLYQLRDLTGWMRVKYQMKANLFYAAVRTGGWFAWRDHRKAEVKPSDPKKIASWADRARRKARLMQTSADDIRQWLIKGDRNG